jgi:excisionase family DNA binding protein
MTTPKVLLTPKEAADVLGVGRTKLYELMGDGLIESVRIGGSRRVPVAAIDRFVEWLRGCDKQDEASDLDLLAPTDPSPLRTSAGSPPIERDGSCTAEPA